MQRTIPFPSLGVVGQSTWSLEQLQTKCIQEINFIRRQVYMLDVAKGKYVKRSVSLIIYWAIELTNICIFLIKKLSQWLSVNNPLLCGIYGFHLWFRKNPYRMKCQSTPVFLFGKSHGQRSLVGYSPWGCKRVGHDSVTKSSNHSSYRLMWLPKSSSNSTSPLKSSLPLQI